MFAKKLKTALETLNISQIKLAQLAGISKAAVSQYLSGKNTPPEGRRKEIATALGLPEDYFEQVLPEPRVVNGYKNLPVNIAADMMGKAIPFVYRGLQDGIFPWGYAVFMGSEWSYFISPAKFFEAIGIEEGGQAS